MAMADPSTTTPPSTNNAASLVDTRKTMVFTYGFMFSFIAFSLFFLFHPSLSASPWLHHIVSLKSSSFFSNSSSSSSSHFSSLLSHFLPPNSSSDAHFLSSSQNTTTRVVNQTQIEIGAKNGTFSSSSSNYALRVKDNVATLSHSTEAVKASSKVINGSSATVVENQNLPQKAGFNGQDVNAETGSEKSKRKENSPSLSHSSKDTASSSNTNGGLGRKVKGDANGISNSSSVLPNGKAGNGQMIISEEEGKNTLYESMLSCDIFDGKWVRDDSYPPYAPGSCPHIDEPFNCFLNGRPDTGYEKYRWQPNNCNIPRLNGKDMLELLRGKRLVFVGDSLNRNMWESLVCALRNSVQDKSRVFEASGKKEFRMEGSYSFIFKDYDCSVEFFRSPFLVQEWEMPNTNGSKIETLRLDLVERSSNRYKDADILIFNTGHWWTHEKTSRGQDYYQEGRHVYGRLNVIEAFRKALTTWARWVDANVNPMKTEVFFRGYSASHFRGGRWNSGGKCEKETEPFKNERFLLKYPPKMKVLESVLKGMKTPVYYLNITRLTDYRKDAHPAVYRAQHLSEEERRSPLRYQDCSHWCLPGVPDTWNELVYARLLIRHYQKQNEEQHHQDQHR